jgi:K+-transporting ATPase A subunit
MGFAWTIVALVAVMAISWRFLGAYMAAVFSGRVTWLRFAERPVYRMLGVDPDAEQSWQRYGVSLIVFSAVALGVTYAIFRLQGYLPFNPQHLPGVTPALAWNTSVSFVTNTNWQAYAGETTMSYLSQMGALAVQNFVSSAVGIAVAVALIRGFCRHGAKTIGNFWVDLVRGTIYILLPIAFVAAMIFMGQGALQTLSGPVHIHGSAFAGISVNTAFYNVINTFGLLLGRFAIMIPVLALAGSLAAKEPVPASAGTFRTDAPMFVGLLTGVVLIVGALTFFPAVSLGPIVEQLSHGRFF